jgi:tmRNA-binding protein
MKKNKTLANLNIKGKKLTTIWKPEEISLDSNEEDSKEKKRLFQIEIQKLLHLNKNKGINELELNLYINQAYLKSSIVYNKIKKIKDKTDNF